MYQNAFDNYQSLKVQGWGGKSPCIIQLLLQYISYLKGRSNLHTVYIYIQKINITCFKFLIIGQYKFFIVIIEIFQFKNMNVGSQFVITKSNAVFVLGRGKPSVTIVVINRRNQSGKRTIGQFMSYKTAKINGVRQESFYWGRCYDLVNILWHYQPSRTSLWGAANNFR